MWIPVYLIVSGGLKIVSQFLEDKSLHCTMTYSFRLTWGILYAASLRRILCGNPSSDSKQWPPESASDEIVSPIHSSRRQHQQREPRSEYWLSESDWLHSPSLYFTIPIQTNIPSQIKKNWNSTLFQFRLKVFSFFFEYSPINVASCICFSQQAHTHIQPYQTEQSSFSNATYVSSSSTGSGGLLRSCHGIRRGIISKTPKIYLNFEFVFSTI